MRNHTDTDLTPYNGLKIRSEARTLVRVHSREDVDRVMSSLDPEDSIHILGSGTNTIWGSSKLDKTVLKMENLGFDILEDSPDHTLIKIGAGEDWDTCVARTVEMGLSGIEALSAIPGTAGAGPVQNIGAYGTELTDTLVEVECYDTQNKQWITLQNAECQFGYRDSIFRRNPNRWIIFSLTLKLRKSPPPIPDYKDVLEFFSTHHITNPTLQEIRDVIINIRHNKLLDPQVRPNCGSFFKNPVVTSAKAEELKTEYPDIPQYPAESGVKISAGWLIEQCGLKGHNFGRIAVYEKNALVLVSEEGVTAEDVALATKEITNAVREKFGIELEREPVLIV